MKAERVAICIKPSVKMYEKMKKAYDEWFVEERKKNPELRAGWLSFVLAMFKVWEQAKEVKNEN